MVLLFGFDVIPLGVVSVVLVALQGTVVGHWCFLCLLSAAISLVLIYAAYDEVWSCLIYLYRLWRRTHNPKLMWRTFFGLASREAAEVAREMTRAA